MTEKRRKRAAMALRRMLNSNVHRKEAILLVCSEFGISRASLYNFCKRFSISTA